MSRKQKPSRKTPPGPPGAPKGARQPFYANVAKGRGRHSDPARGSSKWLPKG